MNGSVGSSSSSGSPSCSKEPQTSSNRPKKGTRRSRSGTTASSSSGTKASSGTASSSCGALIPVATSGPVLQLQQTLLAMLQPRLRFLRVPQVRGLLLDVGVCTCM
jgi:hypothetical protein